MARLRGLCVPFSRDLHVTIDAVQACLGEDFRVVGEGQLVSRVRLPTLGQVGQETS